MDREGLIMLKAEIEAQVREIEDIYIKLKERWNEKGKSAIESTGYQLHNLYCAFEDLFKIIAGAFENRVYDKSQYHIELLKRMSVAIEGTRPTLLSQESYRLLDYLRSFRHFFRHAYSSELDARKVRIVMEYADKLKEIYQKELNAFLESFV